MQRPLKFLAAAGAALVASTTFLATGSTNAQSPATIDFPDDDFDADEDIAFLGEEYDVLELDDVLELCNLDKRDPFRH